MTRVSWNEDLQGRTFNRLRVVMDAAGSRRGSWICQCECGIVVGATTADLLRGKMQSCGCFKSDLVRTNSTLHAQYGTPTYRSWIAMLARCTNPCREAFKDYGGRGITVCPKWSEFKNFLTDMGERPPGKTLDRRDNNAGYSKANCRWATPREQRLNQRPRQKKEKA